MNYTPKELKQAYSIATADLFNRLVKAKSNQTIQIGTLGSFGSLKKTECQMKSGLDGNIYAYYKLNFRPARRLKQALNQALEKKYR
jgi:nucleoid DNA-binding protein